MIDSHCHLAGEEFVADLDAVVARGRERPDSRSCWSSSPPRTTRSGRGPRRWPAPGTASTWPPACIRTTRTCSPTTRRRRRPWWRAASTRRRACAPSARLASTTTTIFSPRDVQQAVFRAQLALAQARDLPVAIHTREAEADTLALIAEAQATAPLDGRLPLLHRATRRGDAGSRDRLLPVVCRDPHLPARRRTESGARGGRRSTACWSKPTRRTWRRCRIAANGTSRRGCRPRSRWRHGSVGWRSRNWPRPYDGTTNGSSRRKSACAQALSR